jgi:hypothetical protein
MMKKRGIAGRSKAAKGSMFGSKSESRKMLVKKAEPSKANPPKFDLDAKQAAGKEHSGVTRGKEKAAPNVAKKPRKMGKVSKAEKAPKIKIKKPG